MIRTRYALLALVFVACQESGSDVEGIRDDPPRIWLAAGPAEGATTTSPVHFYWGGWDADGGISGFEYMLAQHHSGALAPGDTIGIPWVPVRGNDSTFTVEPDSLNTSRSFTFFIRAVDNEGVRSRDTPHRSFTVNAPSLGFSPNLGYRT